MKFATRLIVLFSGIFLISSVSLAYFVYISNLRILEREIKEKLEAKAFDTMDKIDRMMYERYSDVKSLANDSVMRSRSHTPKQIEERLRNYLKESRFYASLSFFTMDRIRVADTSGKFVGKQREFVEYWKDIAAGKEFMVNLHKSVTLNVVVIHFVQLVKDKTEIPLGVVVSRMPVEALYDITEQSSSFTGVEGTKRTLDMDLVDRDGRVLYSNYHKGILSDISPFWEVVKASFASGKTIGSVKGSYLGEDDRAVQDLIKLALEKHGYGVILANNGTDAIEKYTLHKEEIALLLFDAAMPGKSGTEAYEEIRKAHSHIKVLFISGHMAADVYAKAILDKGLPFLSKPFTPNELIHKIHETLGLSSL